MFYVSDDGPGIPLDESQRIFEAYKSIICEGWNIPYGLNGVDKNQLKAAGEILNISSEFFDNGKSFSVCKYSGGNNISLNVQILNIHFSCFD